ncbi:hypothetical protein Q9233_001322 [Columba guinea]|nr:hypothetical protein Q9233_001322 [Columba guinea]
MQGLGNPLERPGMSPSVPALTGTMGALVPIGHFLEERKNYSHQDKKNKYQNFSTTCHWVVVTKTNGKEELAIFDAVMVGVSHQIHPCVLLESI